MMGIGGGSSDGMMPGTDAGGGLLGSPAGAGTVLATLDVSG